MIFVEPWCWPVVYATQSVVRNGQVPSTAAGSAVDGGGPMVVVRADSVRVTVDRIVVVTIDRTVLTVLTVVTGAELTVRVLDGVGVEAPPCCEPVQAATVASSTAAAAGRTTRNSGRGLRTTATVSAAAAPIAAPGCPRSPRLPWKSTCRTDEQEAAMVVTQRRSTAQRSAIIGVLADAGEFQSAQELHATLRAGGSTVGLATVYRALQEMATSGDVDTVRNESGEVLYRRCEAPTHHHHLVCRSCGLTEEVAAPDVEQWAQSVADRFGFVDIDHQIELFGLCAGCAAGRTLTGRPVGTAAAAAELSGS
jgi:Fur family transcriptional regulator, ferric uptake regulator